MCSHAGLRAVPKGIEGSRGLQDNTESTVMYPHNAKFPPVEIDVPVKQILSPFQFGTARILFDKYISFCRCLFSYGYTV